MGMDWSLREGYAWAEDKEHCEEYGRMLNANPAVVSTRAKKRGLPQLGTLGAGNHYAEIQVVDEIFDKFAAGRMGIDMIGQVTSYFSIKVYKSCSIQRLEYIYFNLENKKCFSINVFKNFPN